MVAEPRTWLKPPDKEKSAIKTPSFDARQKAKGSILRMSDSREHQLLLLLLVVVVAVAATKLAACRFLWNLVSRGS